MRHADLRREATTVIAKPASAPCFFSPIDLRQSVVRMRSDRYSVQYIRGSLSWVASGID